jgi:hypothetical protein
MYFSKLERNLLHTRLPNRIIDDLKDEVIYRIVASLNDNKNRNEDEIFQLYQQNGGIDCKDDFNIKWKTGNIETDNVFEMREFLLKLEELKQI